MDRATYIQQPAKLVLGRKLKIGVWMLTIVVWALVGAMQRPELKIPLPTGIDLGFLPTVYSLLNVFVAIFLVLALLQIRSGNVAKHKRFISMAMASSCLFLLLYVVYHFTSDETKFQGQGPVRIAYFGLLISHIVLAALSLPFILLTWVYGYTNQFSKHRKMAKWVFPVWLYVAASGPVCYLVLRFAGQ